MNKTEEETESDIIELVIARIDVMPSNFKLSVGDKGTFTKDEIIKHIKDRDEIGKQIVNMELNFIKALTSGEITRTLTR